LTEPVPAIRGEAQAPTTNSSEPVPTLRGDVRPVPSTPAVAPAPSQAAAAYTATSVETPPVMSPVSPAPAASAAVEPAAPAAPVPSVSRTTANDVARIRSLFNAMRFFDRADYSRAETLAVEVLLAHPTDTVALTIAGAARLKQNNAPGAVEVFTAYVERYPLEAIAHFYLGLAYHQGGERTKAIESYWTAVLLDPALEPARANLEQLRAH
jgi:Flp pilus assembly protein TadD